MQNKMQKVQRLQTRPIARIRHDIGFAYVAISGHPELSSHAFPSDAIVLENGRPLVGPANVLHDEIRGIGAGRYSFWHLEVYFSASDNSDPRTNGRTYAIQYNSSLVGSLVNLIPLRFLIIFFFLADHLMVLAHNISRALVPKPAREFMRRVWNRIGQINPLELSWEIFYWCCFIWVLCSKPINLFSKRKIDFTNKNKA